MSFWAALSPLAVRSMCHALEFERKGVHAPRAGGRDLDGLGEYATGLSRSPVRIDEIDVEREHHAALEAVADHLDRLAVGGDRVVSKARIFQRREPMAVDARLADGEPARIDLVLDRHERSRDCLARAKMLKPATVCGETAFIDLDLLALRL